MKRQHIALGSRLAFSLVMTLAYSGLLAIAFAMHPGATGSSVSGVGPIRAPSGAVTVAPSKEAAPGSLRLRMTLPYMPGGGAHAAEQEI